MPLPLSTLLEPAPMPALPEASVMSGRDCPEATLDAGGDTKVGALAIGSRPRVEPEPPLKRLLVPATAARPDEEDSSVKYLAPLYGMTMLLVKTIAMPVSAEPLSLSIAP